MCNIKTRGFPSSTKKPKKKNKENYLTYIDRFLTILTLRNELTSKLKTNRSNKYLCLSIDLLRLFLNTFLCFVQKDDAAVTLYYNTELRFAATTTTLFIRKIRADVANDDI